MGYIQPSRYKRDCRHDIVLLCLSVVDIRFVHNIHRVTSGHHKSSGFVQLHCFPCRSDGNVFCTLAERPIRINACWYVTTEPTERRDNPTIPSAERGHRLRRHRPIKHYLPSRTYHTYQEKALLFIFGSSTVMPPVHGPRSSARAVR